MVAGAWACFGPGLLPGRFLLFAAVETHRTDYKSDGNRNRDDLLGVRHRSSPETNPLVSCQAFLAYFALTAGDSIDRSAEQQIGHDGKNDRD